MASGIVSAMANSTTLTYTPQTLARVNINWAGTSTNLTVNGVIVATGLAATLSGTISLFVAAGQTLTVVTGAALTALVSSVEEAT